MFIDVNVEHDRAVLENAAVISEGSKGYYLLRCRFSKDWGGLNKYAVFPVQHCSVALSDESIEIPQALIAEKGYLKVGFLGIDDDGSIKIPTNTVCIKINYAVGEEDAAPPPPDERATWKGYIGGIAREYLDALTEAAGGTTWRAATEEEVDDMLKEVFGETEDESGDSGDSGCGCVSEDDVATDEEVEEMLEDVFGN